MTTPATAVAPPARPAAPRRPVSSAEVVAALEDADNAKVIRRAVRDYGRVFDEDEALSYVREAVWRALAFYDPGRPGRMKWTTCLFRCVRNRLIKASDKRVRRARREASYRDRALRDLRAAEARAARPAGPEAPDAPAELAPILGDLPDGFRDLLARHYLDGVPLCDIAREEGVSADFLSGKLKAALAVARHAAGLS